MQAFSFALLIGFTMKLIWPPLLAAIEERQKRIAEGLASAERSQRDLAQAQEKVNDVIKEARAKANEIIEQAHSRGNQIIDQAKLEAVTEANRQKAAALADIDAAAHRAREDLRRQVAGLAVAGAGQLIAREIKPAAHKALLDEMADENLNKQRLDAHPPPYTRGVFCRSLSRVFSLRVPI